ncbi:MAG: energy transducer TonB [Bacteroidales bacterium]|nr:energy transducer TonB [Bacteroidales bacterium]
MQRSCFFYIIFLICFVEPVLAQHYLEASPRSERSLIKSFLHKELIYPAYEMENKIQGTSEFEFRVHKDGSTSDFINLKSVSPSIDQETIRLIKKILWQPATNDGTPIESVTTYSIKFDINQYNRNHRKALHEIICNEVAGTDTTTIIYPFSRLELAPEPIISGGRKNLITYLHEQLKYPEAAFRLNLSGTVTLGFVIEPNGKVSNIYVVQSVGGGCDQEAIRIVESMCWKPGIIQGLAVRSHSKIDIQFKLADSGKGNPIPNRQPSGI